MFCERVRIGDSVGFICGPRRQRPAICEFCKKKTHTKLCDAPIAIFGGQKACDRMICDDCATSPTKGLDYCPLHKNVKPPAIQAALFEGP